VIQRVKGEPLAGTRQWCDMHGLNEDPELKQKILQALKTSPGSAIYVNGICIYRGNDKHFATNEPPRGGRLEDRITRRRSRSLSPDRHRARSPSPRRERSGRAPSPVGYPRGRPPMPPPRYRSRSPFRRQRTPSPYYEPEYRQRSPRYAKGSSAVVFEARDGTVENRPSQRDGRLTPVKINMPRPLPLPKYPPPAFNQTPGRVPLGQVSSNVPQNEQATATTRGVSTPKTQQTMLPQKSTPAYGSMIFEVDDPFFVLGINEGAAEAE